MSKYFIAYEYSYNVERCKGSKVVDYTEDITTEYLRELENTIIDELNNKKIWSLTITAITKL